MKLYLAIFLSLLVNLSKGQFPKYNGNFFSDKQDRIYLSKQFGAMHFENENMYHLLFEKTIFQNDTLKLYINPEAILPEKEYVFKHIYSNDTFFIIKPISNSAIKLFPNREVIKFTKQNYLYDSTVSFEKLVLFEGESPHFFSDAIALQIDSSKNVFFKFKSAFDTSLNGSFKGKLTEKGYDSLINIIRKANIKTLFWPLTEYQGQQYKELTIYYNGQKKKLIGVGDTPYLTMDLMLFLKTIQKHCVYQKTSEKLNFEE